MRSPRFRSPKTAEDESNLLKESIPKSTVYKNKWAVKVFRDWIASRKVEVLVLDPGGAFKDYCELHEVQPLSTNLESMDACSLNYWLSIIVHEVANAEGERYPARTFYGIRDLYIGVRVRLRVLAFEVDIFQSARAQNGKLVLVVVLVLRSKGPYYLRNSKAPCSICGKWNTKSSANGRLKVSGRKIIL